MRSTLNKGAISKFGGQKSMRSTFNRGALVEIKIIDQNPDQ